MSATTKRKRSTCAVQVLRCKGCGAFAVSVNDFRITAHKCAGAWNVERAETVEVALLHQALAQRVTS